MISFLGDSSSEVGRQDIFKPVIGNESLRKIGDRNGLRVVNFATSKSLIVKCTMTPHSNILKFTWTNADGERQSD
jgi:hypothetical protein